MEYKPLGSKYDLNGLLHIMKILRGKDGCPWDKIQTHESIRMNFIEEVYEALESIDTNDTDLLREELGDVLLQVVFHAEIEEESNHFDFSDVVHDVCCKLIIRHPYIFADKDAVSASDALTNWNDIKRKTKGETTYTQTLRSVSKALPGLMRAQKLHSRTEKAGVKIGDTDSVIQKMHQSISEIAKCSDDNSRQKLIGDLLFETALLSHLCDYSAEELLERASDSYIARFSDMEEIAASTGKQIKDCDQQMIQHLINDEEN